MKWCIIGIVIVGLLAGCIESSSCDEMEIKEWILKEYPNATNVEFTAGPSFMGEWYDVNFNSDGCSYDYDFHLKGKIKRVSKYECNRKIWT